MCMGLMMLGRQKNIQQSHWCPSLCFWGWDDNWKAKITQSLGIDQIPAELIKTVGRKIRSDIHKIINSIFNTEILPDGWKKSIFVPIYERSDKTDCNNFRGISFLSTAYRILSIILLSRLTPYEEEIIADYQCEFRCNRSTADHVFCIWQTRDKTWQYNWARN